MTALRTYRTFLAAFLLALYAFIAAPVQLWHHHNYISDATSGTVSANKKNDSVSATTDSSAEANCQVCSHKYSTYNDDAPTLIESSIIFTAAKNGFFLSQLIAVTPFLLPNKGPPALS